MSATPEWLVVLASVLWALSGLPGLVVKEAAIPRARTAGAILGVVGSALATWAAVQALAGAAPADWVGAWPVPRGGLLVNVDALSAVFVLPVAIVGALAAIYGLSYFGPGTPARKTRRFDLFLGLLVAALLFVVTARHGLFFLGAWEVMALSGFLLVSTDSELPDVRRAGWVYLAAAHIGALALFALVSFLHVRTGSWEWAQLGPGEGDAVIFLLALLGFGFKAGAFPFHFWLPGAHAAAPSHASAMLSAVVLKTGVYGLLRMTAMLPVVTKWQGLLVLALGVASALYGVSIAVTQGDLKRLLAYSSIENVGLIFIGIGLAIIGRAEDLPALVALGLGAALLHVWNHAIFKSLLFFAAGAVLHATGTRVMDRLGGLLRRMPITTTAAIVGALAVAGLPPLNGFASEWVLYLGLADSLSHRNTAWIGAIVLPLVAITGALALAAFVKLIGTVFLGAPRTQDGAHAHDPPTSMRAALVAVAILCVGASLASPGLAGALGPAVARWEGRTGWIAPPASLGAIALGAWVIGGLVLVLWFVLARRVGPAPQRLETRPVTWDCGYVAPTPRMQYTARSFAQLLGGSLQPSWMRVTTSSEKGTGLFPVRASFTTDAPDPVKEHWYRRAGARWTKWSLSMRRLQAGVLNLYLLYVLVTLVALMAWTTLRAWWVP